uniref:Variant surface glycoprotein 1125.2778 n=1 Tax=Trypanosoma brucei TaxID=5691 RepID=A0A1J0R8P8_9TRYP|nr:variant surface glycoprotein 1125.2778 [Trypanosoma brucei]
MFSGKVAFLVLTTSFIADKACATFVALTSESWKPQCELAKELRKLPGLSKGKVAADLTAYAAVEKTKLRLLIFATKHQDDPDAVILRVLAAAAEAKQESYKKNTGGVVDRGLKATAYARDLAGAITSAIQTLKAPNNGTTYCLNENSKTENGNTDVEATGCSVLSLQETMTPETLDADKIHNGFKTHTALTGADAKGETANCGFSVRAGGAQEKTAGMQIGQNGSKILLGLGLIEAATTNSPSRKYLSNFKTSATADAQTFFGKAHAAIMAVNQESGDTIGTQTEEQIMKALRSEPEPLTAIKEKLAANQTDGKIPRYASHDNALKTDYFVATGEKIALL